MPNEPTKLSTEEVVTRVKAWLEVPENVTKLLAAMEEADRFARELTERSNLHPRPSLSDLRSHPERPGIRRAKTTLPFGNPDFSGFNNRVVDCPAGFDFSNDMIGRDFDAGFVRDGFVEIVIKWLVSSRNPL